MSKAPVQPTPVAVNLNPLIPPPHNKALSLARRLLSTYARCSTSGEFALWEERAIAHVGQLSAIDLDLQQRRLLTSDPVQAQLLDQFRDDALQLERELRWRIGQRIAVSGTANQTYYANNPSGALPSAKPTRKQSQAMFRLDRTAAWVFWVGAALVAFFIAIPLFLLMDPLFTLGAAQLLVVGTVSYLIGFIGVVLWLGLWWRIFERAGWSSYYAFATLVPIVNLVILAAFAFEEWPVHGYLRHIGRMR